MFIGNNSHNSTYTATYEICLERYTNNHNWVSGKEPKGGLIKGGLLLLLRLVVVCLFAFGLRGVS